MYIGYPEPTTTSEKDMAASLSIFRLILCKGAISPCASCSRGLKFPHAFLSAPPPLV